MPTFADVDEAFQYMAAAKAMAPLLGKTMAERDNALDRIKRLEKEIAELRQSKDGE